ncbi:MAG: BON domain-containing protein [Pirellulaceae bacterium]
MSVFTDRTGDVESSVDIEEQARVRLQHSQYRAIQRVSCRFDAGVLTLEGHVPTFHYKQLAQTAVVEIDGVRRIINEIEVNSPSQ